MKKLWKQSGKRAVAMLLALAMVLSFAQTGLAVTAHAAQNSQSASAGALVANAYGAELKEWEKSILRSGYLKGNTYTYQAPSENNSDGLVSVDADSKTVTVKSYRDAQGNSWTCGDTARIVADGQTVEEVPLSGGKGTFVYTGNAYAVEVTYTLTASVDTSLQKELLNAPYWIAKGVNDLDVLNSTDVNSGLGMLTDHRSILNTIANGYSLGNGGSITFDAAPQAKDLLAQMDRNKERLDVQVALDNYPGTSGKVSFLLSNGAAVKTYAKTAYTDILAIHAQLKNDVFKSMVIQGGVASEAQYDMAVKIISSLVENMKPAAEDAWALLDNKSVLKSGLTSADYLALDALATAASVNDYTFENSSLAKLEVSMTSAAGSDVYKAGSANLLAGTYSAKVQVKVGSVTKTKVLENISVYSVKPDVTMALAAGTPTTVTVNKFDKVEDSVYYRETFTGNNSVVDGGHSAVLFASVTRSTEKGKCDGHWYVVGTSYDYSDVHTAEFATYTMPSLVFTLSNGGDVCKNFTLAIPNNGNNASATFTDGSGTSKPIPIGTINSGSTPRTDGESEKFNYPSQTAKTIGTQEIRTITATYGDETYTIQLSTPLSIVQKNEAVPSLTFKVDDEDFLTPADVVSQDGRAFEVTLPTALYTKDQKTFVVRNESAEPVIEEPIIDGGGDPSAQLPDKNAIPVADWTQGNTTVTRKVYTESHELVEDKLHLDYHGSKTPWGKEYKTLEPAYQNKYTQEKYLETDAEFAIEKDVSQKGTSTVVRTDLNYDVKYSLKAWLVDGKEVEPGKTVRITGNSVAIPVLKGEKTLKETTKTTTVTAGLTHYYFRITCTGTQTTKEGTVGPNETNKWYCSAKTCGSYEAKGSKENAKNAALAVYGPAPVGYTRVNAVTEGRTIDKNSISDWELTDTVPEGGNTTETIEKFDGANKRTQRVTSELTGERLMKKTTETFDSNEKLIRKEVTTYTYDANGNRTSETIVYDGNGNIISGG